MTDTPISKNDPVGANTLQVIASAKEFNKWMYRVIHPYVKGNVLEIGSGIGNISALLLQHHQHVTLSDINPEYCQYLQANFGQHPSLDNIISLNLVAPDFLTRYEGVLNSFDAIVLLNVIEHIEDHDKALENARSLLARNGVLIVLAPAFQFLFCQIDTELGHYRRYTQKTLQAALLNNGFSITASTYFNSTGIAGWLLFGKIMGRKVLNQGEMNIFEFLVPLNKIIDKLMHRLAGLSIICVGKKQD